MLASKLPNVLEIDPALLEDKKISLGEGCFGSVTLGILKTLNVEVVIKHSKGSSQDVEGRVYQALSGSPNF